MIVSSLKKTLSFIWTVLNSLHPRMICIKFDWNWPAGEKTFKLIQYTSTLLQLFPPGKGVDLQLNNYQFPLYRNDLCHFWLKLAKRFWRRSKKCESLTDRQTDRQRTTGDKKSSHELRSTYLQESRNRIKIQRTGERLIKVWRRGTILNKNETSSTHMTIGTFMFIIQSLSKPFLIHWSWLVPFTWTRIRAHGGCDRSTGDAYSS
jgi:hypothetical protein